MGKRENIIVKKFIYILLIELYYERKKFSRKTINVKEYYFIMYKKFDL